MDEGLIMNYPLAQNIFWSQMVALCIPTSPMGLPQIENSRIFGTNYAQNSIFQSGFSISRRPILGIAFEWNGVKKQCARISASSGNSGVDEKVFQFKPSFDEYLKAMESVKSGREKQGSLSSRRSTGKNGKLRDSGGKSSSVVVRKEERDNGGLRSKKEGENGELRDSGGKSSSGVVIKEGKDDGFGLVVEEKKLVIDKKNNIGEEVRKFTKKFITDEDINGKDDGFGLVIEEKKAVVDKKKVVIDKKNIGKEVRKFTKKSIIDEDINGGEILDMEREAFKPLKELEDVYGKPRISKSDMEERIQKLAKCLNGADIDMPEWMFSNMMRSAQIRFSDYSMVRLIQILGKLGNWRRVLQVIEWIQLRERFKSHKLRNIYTSALNVLGKSRRPVEALNLFNLMQQRTSSYPDLVAYRCIAVTLGQAGHMKELFYVIDSMRSPPKKKLKTGVLEKWDPRLEPDIVIYNAVINACVRRKKWEGAFWVLQQLKQQGLQPLSTTYGLVMEVMLACGKYNLVHEFFRKVQKTCIPNALTYKVLLNTLWKEGKIDEAILAVEDMERRGIVGTASLYYDLARCLCSAERCQEALLQIDKLCKVASKPLVVTYTGLIQECIDSGNIKNAADIFKHMQNICCPNLITCNIMLKAFVDHGMFEEAKELFLRMLGNGSSTNNDPYHNVKVMPDLYTFNVMLDACAAEQKWDDLEFAYVNMLKYGFHFNAKRHLQIVLDACTAGKEELLETTWKHLGRGSKVPPFLLIGAMFRLKLEEGDLTAALSSFACHPSIESHAFSTKWWLKFLTENSHRFEKHTLVKLVHAADLLVTITDTQKLILQNLRISCNEFLSKQMKFDGHDSLEAATTTPGRALAF